MRRVRTIVWRSSLLLLAGSVTAGCEDAASGPRPGEAVGFSVAYDNWTPGVNDTCTPDVHNRYSVVGPDGKLYPTWHPPIDPESGCSFGHEHGRDPRGSDLYGEVGDIPFGYASEQLDIFEPQGQRHEDHVGHKIEWENDVSMRFDGAAASSLLEVRCDVLTKLHQGSHSKDAFTNNLHEIVYHVQCSDRTQMHVTMLTAIGTPGEFRASCDRDRTVVVGPPTPLNSPSGGGRRAIPDRACIEEFLLVPEGERSNFSSGLRESWEVSDRVRTVDGHTLASFNPYFQVLLPSRYFDPDAADGVGRPIDVCYEITESGERAQGDACEESTGDGQIASVLFDDPRSAFDGARRFVDINSIRISNAEGPEAWYSDPMGDNAQLEPFPGSIRQVIGRVDNKRAAQPSGPAVGRNRDYGAGQGVHAPN
jgi:hypothetical protein